MTREDLESELLMLRQRVAELESAKAIPDAPGNKAAAEAFRELEEKFRALVENAHEGIHVAQDASLKFVNPALARIYGQSQDTLLSRPFTEFIHPDDREFVLDRSLRRARGEKLPGRYVHRVVDRDGEVRWVEIDSAAILWEGKPAVLVFTTDITERKRMEEAIKEREEHYRTLVEESFDGIMITKGTKIIFANSRLSQMLGYSMAELEGMDHWLSAPPDFRDLVRQRASARMRGENVPPRYESKMQRKDGSVFDVEVISRAIEIQGAPGLQVWIKDITERKQAEEARQRNEELLRTVLGTTPVGITLSLNRKLLWVNEAWNTIFGSGPDGGDGATISARAMYPTQEEFERVGKLLYPGLETGRVNQAEATLLRKDGTTFDANIAMKAVDPSDLSKGAIGTIMDITALKEGERERESLRNQLLQSQKMEALGTLVGGIAHDFNNLLTVINGYTELVLSETTEDDPNFSDLQKVLQTGRKGAELVERLMALSKRSASSPQPLELNSVVKNSVALMKRTFRKMIEIEMVPEKDLAMVNADPAQIEQLLMNLCVNAQDAMPEGGRLEIETRNVEIDENYCRRHPGAKPGPHVLIEVSDTGTGMSKETMDRMFDPFFTTKGWDFRKGTGLGLSVARSIVEQHGGWITCQSELGKGTFFRIYFPATLDAPVAEKPVPAVETLPASGKILLVDDEEYVRGLAKRILEREGYTVIPASNGKEALAIYSKEQADIALIVLDLIMPQMSGEKCLEELLKINPQVKVIVSSGHFLEAPERLPLGATATGFVNKPYDVKQLVQTVRAALDSKGHA